MILPACKMHVVESMMMAGITVSIHV